MPFDADEGEWTLAISRCRLLTLIDPKSARPSTIPSRQLTFGLL